jgi:hypothetical protein
VSTRTDRTDGAASTQRTSPLLVVLAWLVVGVPLVYGVSQTLVKAAKLFSG